MPPPCKNSARTPGMLIQYRSLPLTTVAGPTFGCLENQRVLARGGSNPGSVSVCPVAAIRDFPTIRVKWGKPGSLNDQKVISVTPLMTALLSKRSSHPVSLRGGPPACLRGMLPSLGSLGLVAQRGSCWWLERSCCFWAKEGELRLEVDWEF